MERLGKYDKISATRFCYLSRDALGKPLIMEDYGHTETTAFCQSSGTAKAVKILRPDTATAGYISCRGCRLKISGFRASLEGRALSNIPKNAVRNPFRR